MEALAQLLIRTKEYRRRFYASYDVFPDIAKARTAFGTLINAIEVDELPFLRDVAVSDEGQKVLS